jgi:creatinine amidohydrolase
MEVCRENGQLDRVEIISLSWWSVVKEDFLLKAFNGSFPGWHAEHAGLTETSLMLHLKPDLVREIRPEHSRPPLSGVYLHPIDPMQISDRGVLADTTKSSAELGASLFEHICTELELLLDKPHGMATK